MAEQTPNERLPLHRLIIEGIKNTFSRLDNLEKTKPTVTPNTDIGKLFSEISFLNSHLRDIARAQGELDAYLSLCEANIKSEHIGEIKEVLWNLSQRQSRPEFVSLLRKLEKNK